MTSKAQCLEDFIKVLREEPRAQENLLAVLEGIIEQSPPLGSAKTLADRQVLNNFI